MNSVIWWLGDRVTPVLIPNTEVKPVSADGSRKARVGRRQIREFIFKGMELIRPDPLLGASKNLLSLKLIRRLAEKILTKRCTASVRGEWVATKTMYSK